MRLDVVGGDVDQADLLTRSEEAESMDLASGVWMRCCPQCSAVLQKSSPCETVCCGCGWTWQS